MANSNAVVDKLRAVFASTFRIEAPSADTDLIENGILDSFQLVELLVCIDEEFDVTIGLEDIELDDLRTLERIAALIARQPRDVDAHAATFA